MDQVIVCMNQKKLMIMNKKRFSDLELYTIRNNIPVQTVINNVLHIPAEKSGKYLRFQCPLCCGYNTAVKIKTNLARCFTCEKNFNTIDLVMICKNISFVQSIALLKQYCSPRLQNKKMYRTQEKYDTHNKPDKGMEKIGNILTSMMKQIDNDTGQNNNDNDEHIMKRILTLEQKVEYLIYKIKTK